MRRKQLVAAFLVLLAMMGLAGCGQKKPAYLGDYRVELTEDFKKKVNESVKALVAANPGMKAQAEKGLKDMEANAAKVTLSIKEDGKCTFSMPDNKTENVSYTFADNKLTIKGSSNIAGAKGGELVLTWDESKGTLTASDQAMGMVFKKK